MASPEQIQELRIAINEMDNEPPFSDLELSATIDTKGSVRSAAQAYWKNKAASVAHLVNISEGGSSRSMGSLHQNYLKMAEQYTDPAETAETGGPSRSRTRPIRRA